MYIFAIILKIDLDEVSKNEQSRMNIYDDVSTTNETYSLT